MVKKTTPLVNGYQEAVETLSMAVSHQELAAELDCSVGLLRASLRDRHHRHSAIHQAVGK